MKRTVTLSLSYLLIDLLAVLAQCATSSAPFQVMWKSVGGFGVERVVVDLALPAVVIALLNWVRARNLSQHLALAAPAAGAAALIGWLWFGPMIKLMLWSYVIVTYLAFSAVLYLVLWVWLQSQAHPNKD